MPKNIVSKNRNIYDYTFCSCFRFRREGYEEGLLHGKESGKTEGILLGIEQGAKIGSEVGYISHCIFKLFQLVV